MGCLFTYVPRPVTSHQQHGALYVLLLFRLFTRFLSDQLSPIYLTGLRQIFRVVRTMVVGDQSEISFSIPQGTLPWQPILRALSTQFCCRHTVEFLSFGDIRRVAP